MQLITAKTREADMPRQRKKMTKCDFERITRHLNMTPAVLDRAMEVLVNGCRQIDIADRDGVGVSSVSDPVARVWRAYLESFAAPPGYEEVTALLTPDQAAVVQAWHQENTKRRKPQ